MQGTIIVYDAVKKGEEEKKGVRKEEHVEGDVLDFWITGSGGQPRLTTGPRGFFRNAILWMTTTSGTMEESADEVLVYGIKAIVVGYHRPITLAGSNSFACAK